MLSGFCVCSIIRSDLPWINDCALLDISVHSGVGCSTEEVLGTTSFPSEYEGNCCSMEDLVGIFAEAFVFCSSLEGYFLTS